MDTIETQPQFWLAERLTTNDFVVQRSLALINGPHPDIEGVERSAYVHAETGLNADRNLICVEITEHVLSPNRHGLSDSLIHAVRKVVNRRKPSHN